MNSSPWYQKYSYFVFLLFAAAGIYHWIPMIVSPVESTGVLADLGYPVPAGLLSEAYGRSFFQFLMRWIGVSAIGGDILTAFIALTAWRRGERWSWIAFWLWPIVLFSSYLLYQPGPVKNAPLMFTVLLVVTLVANTSRFFATSRSAEALIASPQN